MKITCIYPFNKPLTLGKSYEVLNEGHIGGIPVYYIIMDDNNKGYVTRSSFITTEELREKKINQILE